jgi:hypothetical protein
MSIILKLDTAAVESLFTEGSEARLQLQHAVIDNIVENMPASSQLEDYVYKQFIKKQFVDVLNSSSDSFHFEERLHNAAKKTVDDMFDEKIYEVTQILHSKMKNEKFDKLEKSLNDKLDSFFKSQESSIILNIKRIIIEKMNSIVTSVFEEMSPTANKNELGE